MKMWQMFAVGVVVLVAALFLPAYERVIAAICALAIVLAVVFGFIVRPRKEVFYLRTSVYKLDPDGELSVEHDRIAVRVELTRLWLLFAPTFAAVAFLLVTAARGSTWNISILHSALDAAASSVTYWVFFVSRMFLVSVIALLSAWVGERWMLRDADACSARHVSPGGRRVSYSFVDGAGEYYGGEGLIVGVNRGELATLVLYNVSQPELNRIALSLLFHRLVVIGRGIADLDEATVAAHVGKVVPARIPT